MIGNKNLHRRNFCAKWIPFAILLVFSVVWLIPFVWAFGTSLKTEYDIANHPAGLLPTWGQWTFEKYSGLLWGEYAEVYPVARWLLNSVIVAVSSTVLSVIFAAMAAYALVFFDFKAKKFVISLFLVSMMIPGIINLIPLYVIVRDFDMGGSIVGLIIPSLANVFGMIVIRSFFSGIPKDLTEAAELDGASKMCTFWKIIVPLGKNAIIVVALFAFMGSWNDFLFPQLVLANADLDRLTLAVGLTIMSSTSGNDIGGRLAAAFISMVPVLIFFICTQNKLMDGINTTGIK